MRVLSVVAVDSLTVNPLLTIDSDARIVVSLYVHNSVNGPLFAFPPRNEAELQPRERSMATETPAQVTLVAESKRVTPNARHVLRRSGGNVPVSNLWFEVDIDDGWRAAFRLVPYANGEPVVAEIRVFPADEWPDRAPGTWRAEYLGLRAMDRTVTEGAEDGRRFPNIGQGVTAQLLRKVPLRSVQRVRKSFAEQIGRVVGRQYEAVTKDGMDPQVATALQRLHTSGFRSGPTAVAAERRADAWPDLRYAQLAAAYVERIDAGSRSPIADIARQAKDLSAAQVRDAIHTARKRGLLSETRKRGVPGGQLTAVARALLNEKGRQ